MKIKVGLVFCDWMQSGTPKSIYNTELGCDLSMGQLHSGTTFEEVEVNLPDEQAEEIIDAWKRHGAYPVFAMMDAANLSNSDDNPNDFSLQSPEEYLG